MNPFFRTPERLTNFQCAAHRWMGTPFAPHAAMLGVGVDCVSLLSQLYDEAGFQWRTNLPDDFPAYTCDGGQASQSKVIRFLAGRPDLERIADVDSPLITGDILCFTASKTVHHVGAVVRGRRFIHAIRSHGVILSLVDDPTYRKRLEAIFRPVEPEPA